MKQHWNIRVISYLAILTAIGVALLYVQPVRLWNVRVSFSFIPVSTAGILFGPAGSAAVSVLLDLLGAILVPSGAFFPGYTLTALLNGLIWGLCLHKSRTLPRAALAVLANQILCTLLLNTFWISLLNGVPFRAQFLLRLVQSAITAPIQFCVVGFVLLPFLRRFASRLLPRHR